MSQDKRNFIPYFVFASLFVGLIAVTCLCCYWDQQAGLPTLSFLTPAINLAISAGGWWRQNALEMAQDGLLSIAIFALVIVLRTGWGARQNIDFIKKGALLLAFLLCIAAELAWATKNWSTGTALFATGAILCIFLPISSIHEPPRPAIQPRFGHWSLAALLAIVAIGIVFRFYALNRVLAQFEGELSPYMLGATSFHGILLANIGQDGPWAPLGYLYYLPILATTKVFGTTLLAVRLASALVSVATIPLSYMLVRALWTPGAGLIAAALVAIDPMQIGWGRSDIHPHGSTVWITFLISIFLIRAYRDGSAWSFAMVALLMGLSCHQYPSGQFAVFLPITVACLVPLLKSRDAKAAGFKVAFFGAGALLWLGGFPLQSYLATGEWRLFGMFARLGPRVSWGGHQSELSLGETLSHIILTALDNGHALLSGLCTEFPHLFFQTLIPEVPGLSLRALPWLVVGLSMPVLFLSLRSRRFGLMILPTWIAIGMLPSLLSDLGDPKRAATIYPAVICCAGIGAAWLQANAQSLFGRLGRVISSVGIACYFVLSVALSCFQWFSGARYAWGEPEEHRIVEALKKYSTSETIIVPVLWDTYITGKLSYLLSGDFLSQGQNMPLWYPYMESQGSIGEFAANPEKVIARSISNSMWYEWAPFHELAPQLVATRRRKQILYLLQTHSYGEESAHIRGYSDIISTHCSEIESWELESTYPPFQILFKLCKLPDPE